MWLNSMQVVFSLAEDKDPMRVVVVLLVVDIPRTEMFMVTDVGDLLRR